MFALTNFHVMAYLDLQKWPVGKALKPSDDLITKSNPRVIILSDRDHERLTL
jgi:hypothetical protein